MDGHLAVAFAADSAAGPLADPRHRLAILLHLFGSVQTSV